MPDLIHEPNVTGTPTATNVKQAIMVHDAQAEMDAHATLEPVVNALRVNPVPSLDADFEVLKALVTVYGPAELKRMIDNLK